MSEIQKWITWEHNIHILLPMDFWLPSWRFCFSKITYSYSLSISLSDAALRFSYLYLYAPQIIEIVFEIPIIIDFMLILFHMIGFTGVMRHWFSWCALMRQTCASLSRSWIWSSHNFFSSQFTVMEIWYLNSPMIQLSIGHHIMSRNHRFNVGRFLGTHKELTSSYSYRHE
jgi:hypothetical protein